jgi:hypothetical protein
MDGVPLYDVQALLGHESFATTQRCAHLTPDTHSRVMESWVAARTGHGRRGVLMCRFRPGRCAGLVFHFGKEPVNCSALRGGVL